ncbi:unnamed protein product [Orchesella dallaii]|uniref:Guanylate-binding protein N-terminal domain-containing protein n=1 Tax=Orchesella dallaii TaxID=48710 RepID=A0ABP1RR17_9HEXA
MASSARAKSSRNWKQTAITSSSEDETSAASDYDVVNKSRNGKKMHSSKSPNGKWNTSEAVPDEEDEVEEPIQIVHFGKIRNSKVSMTIDDEKLEKCLKAAGDYPMCIINIVGPPNLGKGFVLNVALRKLEAMTGGDRNWMGWDSKQGKMSRFPFGNRSEKNDLKSAGISLFPRPFLIDTNEGRIAVFVMETNGLHNDAFDSMEALTSIFCLSFLTSSMLIYNTCEDELTEDSFMPWIPYLRFGKKALEAFDSLDEKPFQALSFLVRDWEKPQEYCYGETDGKKYLFEQIEQLLDPKTNKYISKALKDHFASTGCFLLPSAGDGFKTSEFDGSVEMLDGEFLKKLEKYISGLISSSTLHVKKIYKDKLTSSLFKQYLSAYVQLINSYNRGSGDLTGDSLHQVSMATLTEYTIDKTVTDYRTEMQNQKGVSTYVEENSLYRMHGNAKKQAELSIKTALPKLPQQEIEIYGSNLSDKITAAFDGIRNENQKHREDFIAKNVNATLKKYEERLNSKINLGDETKFYDESEIQNASAASLNIKQQLYDSCLTEGDDDFEEIKNIILKKASEILHSFLQKNSRNRNRAENIIASFNRNLIENYKEDMRDNTEGETPDISSLRFMHRQLKKQSKREFQNNQPNFPGDKLFQERFLDNLESTLDEIFATHENGEKSRLEDKQEKANSLVTSLKLEFDRILKSQTDKAMTQNQSELDSVLSNSSTKILTHFDQENPFSPGSTTGKILRETLQRDLELANQNYMENTIKKQKKIIESYKKSRDQGVNSYIESMEAELKAGFFEETSLQNLHDHQQKNCLQSFDELTDFSPDASDQRSELKERISEAFENFKVANARLCQQAKAEAEKLLTDLQQQYNTRMSGQTFNNESDVEGAHKKCLDEYYKQLEAKLGEGNEELKESYYGKIKNMLSNTYQSIRGTVELNKEKERLQFFAMLNNVQEFYHNEMKKQCDGQNFRGTRELENVHRRVSDDAILNCNRKLKIQVSPENRKRLLNAMSDSFTKYQMKFTMNKTIQTQKPAIGIDLGTTYCCVAIWKDQKMKIITSSEGDSTTPSYVAFKDDGSHVVGQTAKDDSYRNPENTIFDAKRMIGRRMTDSKLQDDMKYWPFNVVEHNGVPKINIRNKPQPPEYVSAVLLSELKAQAEEQLGMKVERAVITVPAYFNDGQRAATVDAGEMAGLKVLTILSEPTAAAIAYKVENFSDLPRKVLVYDLGGGTFDVAVLQTGAKSIDVLGVDGDTHLGGEDFDKNLMEECVKIFLEKTKINLLQDKDSDVKPKKEEARRILRRLQTYSEKAKRQLSSALQATISVDGIIGGKDLYAVITRARFEELNQQLFQKTIEIVDKALKDANVRKEEIDDILLVGGSTRIPKIKEMLSQHFGGKKLSHSVHPDTAVANGAAVQAALLNGGSKEFNFESIRDVTPMSLGIEADIGKLKDAFSIIIPKNTKIPCKYQETYVTTADNQRTMKISVYQGEYEIAKDNNLLGTFQLAGISPARAGCENVDVTMEIDEMGILHVTAAGKNSRNSKSLTVEANKGRLSLQEKKEITTAIEKIAKKPVVDEQPEGEGDDDAQNDDWFTSAAHSQKQVFDDLEVPLEE